MINLAKFSLRSGFGSDGFLETEQMKAMKKINEGFPCKAVNIFEQRLIHRLKCINKVSQMKMF